MEKTVKYKLLSSNAKLPTRATPGSAGYDLYAAENKIIPAGQRTLLTTDLALEMPSTIYAKICALSGLSLRSNIDIAAGLIDSDYVGVLGCVVVNNGDKAFEINIGNKVAQVVFSKLEQIRFEKTNELAATARGGHGFGSTGE